MTQDELFEESVKEIFAKRLKIARKKMKLTQNELAHIIEVDPRDISKYETKRNFPKVTKIVEIAITLNVSTDYLFGIKEDFN